uniref:Uncharacterized protein n=1 Tax=Candidatus Kentrum sp. FW TaxID=2126338 RepID=A0A450SEG4_9GAMM|nr:MAG: hypothetical protein BECKFW1821A_GA0114235_103017 [Candidatus Kentron sp. FW]VFJ61265.1 MAG: hypothetical protein BECKFW1821B_GA0114236_106415 [Candidatus Kentron sp. FW]
MSASFIDTNIVIYASVREIRGYFLEPIGYQVHDIKQFQLHDMF